MSEPLTRKSKVAIFATDFKPMLGGVAEYTYQLAKELDKLDALDCVLTPVIQNQSYNFPVVAPRLHIFGHNTLWILRKLNGILYLCQMYSLFTFRILSLYLKKRHRLLVINWICSDYSKYIIQLSQRLGIRYGIILYGKDIIQIGKKNPNFWKQVCVQANLLIFITEATKRLFEETMGEVQTPYYILKPGIDTEYLDSNSDLSREELERRIGVDLRDKHIVVTVARLVKRKGIHFAVQALAPLLRSNRRLLYVIVGTGPEQHALEDLVHSLDLKESIIFVGGFNDREKFSLLNISSIFIHPNYLCDGEDFEGFGISFIEASYLKNAVIGGRNGGTVEAIKDGYSGYLVDSEDIYKLRQTLHDLIDQASLIERLSTLGRHYVLDNFQVSNLVYEFEHFLQHNMFDSKVTEFCRDETD